MFLRNLIFSLTLLFSSFTFAQKEAAIWYFGGGAGLDFNSGSPVPLLNGMLHTNEGCATISDKDGNLLFYTDGKIVYDKTHQNMPNGYGLLGHSSSTQSAIIVPKPKNPYIYYIFTVDEPNPLNVDDFPDNDEDPPNSGLNYSTVDLRLNGGLGDIVATEKNIPLITYNPNDSEDVNFKCSEKITAIQHGDGISFWVITHFKNTFYSFKIGTNGVDLKPVKTVTNTLIPLGGYNSNAIGYLKASPNGKKIAMANMSTRLTNQLNPKGNVVRNTGNVFLYDFDSSTGKVSNDKIILSGANPYGVEFSPKSKKLYITTNQFDINGNSTGSDLVQFDLLSSNIAGSIKTINSSTNVAGALQLAIDEKIYRAGYQNLVNANSTKLSVINNPESDGTSCNYMPNSINLTKGEIKLGLPPFITSLFLYSFDYEFNCLGQSTHFFIKSNEKIDSVLWNFGDGQKSNSKDSYHTYTKAGEYKVTLIKTVNGEQKEPLEKTITIYDSPKIRKTPYKLIQCDTQDDNPTDGLALFGLPNANESLTLGNKDYEVYFYHSISDAENDTNNINSIEPAYRNTIPDEIIYAKITQPNSSCYEITSVILHANTSIIIPADDVNECDLGNNNTAFDLDKIKDNIKIKSNLPSDVRLLFYENENNASIGKDELKGIYNVNQNQKEIILRAENNEGCYGTGKFNLIVTPLPQITAEDEKTICESDPDSFVTLDSSLSPDQVKDYSFLWSNGSTESSIQVNSEGEYTLQIKNANGCIANRTLRVKLLHIPKIKDIKINDLEQENEVAVELFENNNYTYSIRYQNGETTTLQDSPFFQNVPGGFHQLIIGNKNGCPGIITRSFAVLDAPKFFTPNNDGYNDYWNLNGINDPIYKNAVIFIYDRYGKLLQQLSPFSQGWNGIYNNSQMPADDYWFTIKLEDGRKAGGHFSLKR